ncbi:MAG TPA: metal-sensitive transcriptional regulator [Elusimicrobiales bacterium]|nr:metal-sensitive transcriptional regulator [Elusimicrobiales bacterium]HOL63057.1 metal-sensitive transcriptional regulator [Elusimicrobiales bacterium]HPO95334.1 metal-sensitive transcriptional regulator [Elusimicrobiales bacterium]
MIDDKLIKKLKPRLKRIEGQVNGISKMIEKKEYCVDIFQQISAVIGALKSVNALILENHLNTCVKNAMASKNEKEIKEKIKELTEIYKKY